MLCIQLMMVGFRCEVDNCSKCESSGGGGGDTKPSAQATPSTDEDYRSDTESPTPTHSR